MGQGTVHRAATAQREGAAANLVELLRDRAAADPDLPLFTFLERGEEIVDELTAAAIDLRARAIAAQLQAIADPGARSLLFFKPGPEFTTAYWACLCAGAIAVPVPSPGVRAVEALPRLRAVARDAGATVLMTTSDVAGRLECADGGLDRMRVLAVDEVGDEMAPGWSPPALDGDSVAHLQYSSGSTGTPKGAVITHANVLDNLRVMMAVSAGDAETDIGVSWLPMFHDMGLVTGVLLPVFGGGPGYFMSPLDFLQRPARWLSAMSELRATVTAAPNFALDLCVERVDAQERRALDLSSWRLLTLGSEMIRPSTLRRFAEAFAPCGFDRRAYLPCYGLAEMTLTATGGPFGSGATELAVDRAALGAGRAVAVPEASDGAAGLVGCGRAPDGVDVVVADPETLAPVDDGRVGEILLAGGSVAAGYWNDEAATREAFGLRVAGRDGAFHRTGDLGFLREGELFITGRRKDVVIVGGQNHYPQDLELTATESHAALRRDRCVAMAVDDGEHERLVVVAEVDRRLLGGDGGDPVVSVRAALAERHGVRADEVLLVRRVPITSSGKLRRGACRDLYLAGAYAEARPVAAATP
ncbi:MAG TPA: fatty acyl-AMP ligase [Solirubrobacteraceae bacterium]|nr:fatty acyl-AMP ligase [Solirubrobacteraceae bacterium]